MTPNSWISVGWKYNVFISFGTLIENLIGALVEGEDGSDGDASGNGDSSPDHLQEASVNIW